MVVVDVLTSALVVVLVPAALVVVLQYLSKLKASIVGRARRICEANGKKVG
ncbi:hypothetical protein Hanom_Chr13g01217911 [Helianthus anomalus]